MKFNFKIWFKNNFPENRSSFKQYYRILEIAYEIIGLNHFRSTWTNYNYLEKFYSYFGIVIVLCIPWFSVIYLTNNTDDLDELLTCLISFFTAVHVNLKVLTIVFSHKALNELRDIVVENTSDENLSDRESHQMALDSSNIARRTIKLTLFAYFCAWVYFNMYPIFSSKQWILPLAFAIPGIPHRNHPGYEITYVFVFYQTIYALMSLIGFDGYVILTSIYISFRLELCKHYFRQIGDFTTKYNTVEKQTELLMKCARLHTETFVFTQRCSKLFRPTILFQVLATVGLLCTTMIHIRMNIYNSSCMMFQASLLQVFLYCCCGELIVSQASGVTRSIYESKWYNIRSKSELNMILFMLQSSQIQIGFSVAGFYKLSMQSFTEICKTAYTFFTFFMKIM